MEAQFAEAKLSALLLTGLVAFATLVSCNTEGDILYKQKVAWEDPENVMQTWDPTLHNPCSWMHITCNNDNSVIRVDLLNVRISGPLIPQLGGLKNLQYLRLSGNNLTGTIPPSLGNLKSLEILELRNNALSGIIPASLGDIETLNYLDLNDNMLTGTVPLEILSRLVTTLDELNVAHNDLDGTTRKSVTRVTTVVHDMPKTSN
uniref:Leucine-rich repeat-containing N-terminal plant-type domain-containing protein n=1 Tax=Oryza punctata TaxID=4537 RepID=A0A0E0MFS6_ORYPU